MLTKKDENYPFLIKLSSGTSYLEKTTKRSFSQIFPDLFLQGVHFKRPFLDKIDNIRYIFRPLTITFTQWSMASAQDYINNI